MLVKRGTHSSVLIGWDATTSSDQLRLIAEAMRAMIGAGRDGNLR